MFNTKRLELYQNKIIDYVVMILNIKQIKEHLKLSKDFGKNPKRSFEEILKKINKDPLKFLIYLMISLYVIKLIFLFIKNKALVLLDLHN